MLSWRERGGERESERERGNRKGIKVRRNMYEAIECYK